MIGIDSRVRQWTGANGLGLVAECFGDPAAPPVVLLHGGGQTRRAWRGGAQAIAAAGYLAVTFDQRGHGESDWAPDGDYSPEAGAADLACLLEDLGRPAVLVGASRGGYSALTAAAGSARALVRALVLIEIAPRIDMAGAGQVRGFMRASAVGFATVQEAATLLAKYLHRPPGKDPQRLARAMRQGRDGRFYWRWDPKVAVGVLSADPEGTAAAMEAAVRRLRCPVLLVYGDRSELVKEPHVAAFRALAPAARVVKLADTGHMMTGDENDGFVEATVSFLGLLPAPTLQAPVETLS